MIMTMIVRVTVSVIMIVRMVMGVVVQRRPRQSVLLAEFLITAGCITIALAGTILESATDALNMVVVTFLRQTHLIFKSENLLAEFAHLAIHHVLPMLNLIDPIHKGFQNQGMVIEIGCLVEFDISITLRDRIRVRRHSGGRQR